MRSTIAVVRVPIEAGYATSAIVERIRHTRRP
jgi:hypothetical protein